MIRTPFHLPSGICLISDPVWVGKVYSKDYNGKHLLDIGTACGIITEWNYDKQFIENLRDNLISEERKQSMGPR